MTVMGCGHPMSWESLNPGLNEAPRHLLYQALDDLSRREAAAAAPPAAPATTATAKAPPAAKAAPKAAQAKARSAAKAPVLSRQLEETLEAMPMSRSCRGVLGKSGSATGF